MASTPAVTAEHVENGSTETPGSEPQAEAPGAPPAETTSAAPGTDAAKTGEDVVTENPPASESAPAETAAQAPEAADKKWPGWPGNCVFRLVVPVLKVGSIIGRKGELIKKMCEETRARIRVLDAPVGTPDRVVLISGKEELEAPLSPAMDAVIRVFKRVSGLPAESDSKVPGAAEVAFCSIRLLVASTQAINLIGRQGSSIKSIQEGTGASVRVLSSDEGTFSANSDEKIVELQGEALKVLKALESVLGHLRKFLVDHSVLPLFEKSYNPAVAQERQVETWGDKSLLHSASQTGFRSASQTGFAADYPLPSKRDSLLHDRETQLEPYSSKLQATTENISNSGISVYSQDPGLSAIRSSGIGRAGGPFVTQITQTMQIPLSYAEDIIGVGGANIAYIRRTSDAVLTVQESRGVPDAITVEIKGSSSQVQTAQQLIQEFMHGHKEPVSSSYDTGYRSAYSQLGISDDYYPGSSLSTQPPLPPYSGYSSGLGGGYSNFRY